MSETQILAGGAPVPSLVLVSTDQHTILGDGSQAHPLRDAAPSVFTASFLPDLPSAPELGMAVALINETPVNGQLYAVKQAGAAVGGATHAAGVITKIDSTTTVPTVTVQAEGLVTLTVAEWNTVTGGVSGLVPGDPYYLSATAFGLVLIAPSASGTSVSQVGIGASPTTMLLSTPTFPRVNP